jgi:hypothetical protein
MAWHTAFGLFTVEDGWWESVYTESILRYTLDMEIMGPRRADILTSFF